MSSANHRPNLTVRVTRLGPKAVADDTHPCVGCRTELPPTAVFCVECGLCQLGITQAGTVIAESPYLAPEHVAREDSGRIELDDFDLLIELDDEDDPEPYFVSPPGVVSGTIPSPPKMLFRRRKEETVVASGPVRARPHWDAPPKGLTVAVPTIPVELTA